MTYKDPLHVGFDQLTVKFDGVPLFILNKRLLDMQNCWENLEDIKEVHELKFLFQEMMKLEKDLEMLRSLAADITECEFELQRLWKFSLDANYHRFWIVPKCECPRMDNEDRYPHGHYIINLSCPIHGDLK